MSVYFIFEMGNAHNRLKIGRARNIHTRLRNLQTGNPTELLLVGWIEAADDNELERSLHKHFATQRRMGEWFEIEPADVQSVILRAGQQGFVAKNADAFKIIGYDKDAVPEFAGVWEWGDLALEECCPFCGCCCGIHFQEASSLYHCLNCDVLTDFEDVRF
ncbi:MAG: GIY-YIG nuclease family protein [Rhodospirillaceae bacterium]|nr:GIY-YIG nuclease family protein [Rhodospirillales bacterium]